MDSLAAPQPRGSDSVRGSEFSLHCLGKGRPGAPWDEPPASAQVAVSGSWARAPRRALCSAGSRLPSLPASPPLVSLSKEQLRSRRPERRRGSEPRASVRPAAAGGTLAARGDGGAGADSDWDGPSVRGTRRPDRETED